LAANPKPTKPTVTIHINKVKLTVDVPITGAQLRSLGSIPDANQLFLEAPGPEPDTLIVPGESYTLKNGAHLYDLPKGTVGGADRDRQIQFASDHLPGGTSETKVDGRVILRWAAEAPEGWEPGHLDLLIEVPPMYPAQAPSGFDASGLVRRAGGQPAGAGQRDLDGIQVTHFCWNPAGEIKYADEDGLWRYARFSETRFAEAN
jgi:hypothetical protein